MQRKRYALSIVMGIAVAGVLGCSQVSEPPPAAAPEERPDPAAKPVTLKVYDALGMTQEHFDLLLAVPVKAKYPHITLERVQGGPKQVTDALTAREPIDLIMFFHGNWGDYKDLNVIADLNPLLTAAKYNLNRFDPGALKAITAFSKSGELYGLPFHMQFNALYYNKDLFDKFGVAYPADGMTWEDTIELAKKLTRQEGDTSYAGFSMDVWTRLTLQLGVLPVDAGTQKPNVNGDKFRKALGIAKQLYSIPGNPPVFGRDPFVKNKTMAMFGTVNILDVLPGSGMNWDVAQFPSYKDSPNLYTQYDLHLTAISSTSSHKEDAVKTLEVFLSDDVQKISASKTGRLPVLADPVFKTYFGADNPALAGKRLASIFKSKPNPDSASFTKYHTQSYQIANKHVMEFLQDKKDMNTALRAAEEEISAYIAANP